MLDPDHDIESNRSFEIRGDITYTHIHIWSPNSQKILKLPSISSSYFVHFSFYAVPIYQGITRWNESNEKSNKFETSYWIRGFSHQGLSWGWFLLYHLPSFFIYSYSTLFINASFLLISVLLPYLYLVLYILLLDKIHVIYIYIHIYIHTHTPSYFKVRIVRKFIF